MQKYNGRMKASTDSTHEENFQTEKQGYWYSSLKGVSIRPQLQRKRNHLLVKKLTAMAGPLFALDSNSSRL